MYTFGVIAGISGDALSLRLTSLFFSSLPRDKPGAIISFGANVYCFNLLKVVLEIIWWNGARGIVIIIIILKLTKKRSSSIFEYEKREGGRERDLHKVNEGEGSLGVRTQGQELFWGFLQSWRLPCLLIGMNLPPRWWSACINGAIITVSTSF